MISVVIPCYNAEATLAATVESALRQDVAKEIIIVDDGSTDGSGRVIEMFASAVRSVRIPNGGVSAARTLGTSLSTGAYVQYLDSDDVLAAGTLERRLGALEATGADIAHTDWQKLYATAGGDYRPGEVMRPDLDALECSAEAATATARFWAPPVALLYRRSIVDRVGGWNGRLAIAEDARFLFDAARCGAKFVYVPGVGADYRVSPSSLSRKSYERFIHYCALNTAEIEAIWRGDGTLDPVRRKALAEMWYHVAAASLDHGFDGFDAARTAYNAVSKRSLKLEIGHGLRHCFGPRRASAMAQSVLEFKKRRASPPEAKSQ